MKVIIRVQSNKVSNCPEGQIYKGGEELLEVFYGLELTPNQYAHLEARDHRGILFSSTRGKVLTNPFI
jgi:hypothetical protein